MNSSRDTLQRWFPAEFIGRVKELGQIYTFMPFDLKAQRRLLYLLLRKREEKYHIIIKIKIFNY